MPGLSSIACGLGNKLLFGQHFLVSSTSNVVELRRTTLEGETQSIAERGAQGRHWTTDSLGMKPEIPARNRYSVIP